MLTISIPRGFLCLFLFCLMLIPPLAGAANDELALTVLNCSDDELHKAKLELSWYDDSGFLKDTMVEYTHYGEVLFEFFGLEAGDYVVVEVTPAQGDPFDSYHRFDWEGDGDSQDNWSPPPPPPPGGGGSGSLANCYDSCDATGCTIRAFYTADN